MNIPIYEMRTALLHLINEVSGLEAFEMEIREAIGNTNWNVLMLTRDNARAVMRATGGPNK